MEVLGPGRSTLVFGLLNHYTSKLTFSLYPFTAYCLTNGDLRLNGIGSSGLVGRLEVFYNDRWGTVCGGRENLISNFNDDTAQVACRQMGLGFAVDYYSLQHLPEHR